MSEIYRDSTGKAVAIGIDGAAVTSVKFKRYGEVVSTGTYSPAQIPYSITHLTGPFDVEWEYTVSGDSYKRTERHEVVTPLFNSVELKNFNSEFEVLSDAKIVELERLIREIIQSHTGQSFGYREGTLTVRPSHSDTILMTNERIISVTSVGVGSYATVYPYAYRPIKTGFGIEFSQGGWGNAAASNGSISDPYSTSSRAFARGTEVTIHGAFGWETVPTDINTAALLLAELLSCNEATWRDRYLKAVTAADWRFDFDGRAFSGTGSVTVDQLLDKYRVGGMAII